ncbi:MAG: 4-(cytidine 5'-diphospho)-2-C-methyl-D-erythritol kinase [Hyphomicrobiaceae bacterium]|nr:4-(cytidine 5'-diphospho)-2-C-methyl-D-erythritol kinase [Hyphomicrobiaceae bacterium]
MTETVLAEAAPAKVNVTLCVRGRRPDGYHELESLVVFAGVGDVVQLEPGLPLGLSVSGPRSAAVGDGTNLVLEAARAVGGFERGLRLGRFHLEKNLPVAAGLGGGSSDAAAALRLIRAANPDAGDGLDWAAIAARIGADVPVCLINRAAVMTGLGEQVTPLPHALPAAWMVLANPGIPLATPDVFRALAAPPLAAAVQPAVAPWLDSFEALLDYAVARPNDLEAVAVRLCPAIAEVQRALADLDGARLVRMSGSGPTCFALFDGAGSAVAGARRLGAAHPDWWVRAAPVS